LSLVYGVLALISLLMPNIRARVSVASKLPRLLQPRRTFSIYTRFHHRVARADYRVCTYADRVSNLRDRG
jgi:hypothetical protein